MITPSYLDLIMWRFNAVVEAGWAVIMPPILWLFWSVAGIYLLWAFIRSCRHAESPIEIMLVAFFSMFKVFLFYWALSNTQRLGEIVLIGMVNIGLAVGGAAGTPLTFEQFMSPGTVLAQSWQVLKPLKDHWNTIGGLSVIYYAGPFVMYLISLLVCLVAFLLISLHVVVAVTTFKIMHIFGTFLMALGILPLTGFVAQAPLHGIIACSVRLGVLALVQTIILPLVHGLGLPANQPPDFWSALSMAAGSVLLTFLSWKAPNYAAELMGARIAAAAGDLIALIGGMSYAALRGTRGGVLVGQEGARATAFVAEQARTGWAMHRAYEATLARRALRRPA